MHFATTCIDNFFKYPDGIRNYANSLEYEIPKDLHYPGRRTKLIQEINPLLHEYICIKYLQNHYICSPQLTVTPPMFKSEIYFQKINGKYNKGWVHGDQRTVHTTIIYLTPDAPLDSGTSLFQMY